MPVDEAPQEPSFAKYRERLQRAAGRGELRTVLSMVSPSIRLNEDALPGGIAQLTARWKL